ncbi:PREDICTED: uncharacterized protein LOC107063880 [Polistes dominula]|uniref:Uncharacterized protein LOC107063880 n=1 Tax=Polistes dominula TaxID=743375 RepID=A0ABM1HU70_POLDO|nr:PREDICTED: uncharacterized protein LOC107063880 [Polistes dominula]
MEEDNNMNFELPAHTITFDISNNNSHNSHDSVDSGYLTLTPRSSLHTPIIAGYKSLVTPLKRHLRIRQSFYQSNRAQRYRSKLNQLPNKSTRNADPTAISSENEDCAYSSNLGTSNLSITSQSHSLEHASPCSTSHSLNLTYEDFNEGSTSSIYGAWRTTMPVTLASASLQILSPPPSPAIPSLAVPSSSFIASEPIEEDVEMKLVIMPQSTPQETNSNYQTITPCIAYSPTGRKTNNNVTSTEDPKLLNKLCVVDIPSIAEIKPKRLDFSHRAFSLARHRTKVKLDYTGRKTVDLLALLGEKSNHWRIISKILSFLAPQDLCSISMVSKVWRRICKEDSRANTRRLSHIILRQNTKENLKLKKKVQMEMDIQSSPRNRYVRKGCLLEVQNLVHSSQQRPPNSPPVSPSKVKFHSFVKASRTLEPWEHLLPCPRCSFPCHVDGEKNVGTCSRQGCSMEFCTSCSSRPHTGPCKTPLLATPTKRNKRLVVGSRQSKRNLRRL